MIYNCMNSSQIPLFPSALKPECTSPPVVASHQSLCSSRSGSTTNSNQQPESIRQRVSGSLWEESFSIAAEKRSDSSSAAKVFVSFLKLSDVGRWRLLASFFFNVSPFWRCRWQWSCVCSDETDGCFTFLRSCKKLILTRCFNLGISFKVHFIFNRC